jgi:hypothetical protein
MKKITGIFMLALSALIVGSCKKDITLTPLNGVAIDQYFHNAKDVTTGLAGIYSSFQEEMAGDGTGKDEGYGGRYHYWGDARSDNFDRGQYTSTATTEMSLNGITNTNTAADWAGLYRTIARANLCIKYFPGILAQDNTLTQATLNNALAQCYAMRAECYLYIIKNWGDAPIWTEPYEDILQPPAKARSSKNKIMDSVIIPDLTRAYTLTTPKAATSTVWYINEGAICAIAADAYMWRAGVLGGGTADYKNAITWVKNLFAAKGSTGVAYAGTAATLEPTATWKNVFLSPATSTESIWSINWDYTVNGCACVPVSIQLNNNPLKVDSSFVVKWKPTYKTDIRAPKTIDTLFTTGHADKIFKFYNLAPAAATFPTSPTALFYNVYLPMYRLGDIYLTYAEALAYTGDLPNALIYLNYIRARAAATPYTAAQLSTTTAMIDAIVQEGQYEEFGEGKRWFDLIRTGSLNKVMDPILKIRQFKYGSPQIGFGTDLNKAYWPISRDALNGNRLLTQNASY